jgi:hypothetical protein
MHAPDPPHLNPNSCFEVLWTVSLLQELRDKTGRTGAINALVRATKSRGNFSHFTHLIHPIALKLMFWSVLDVLLLHELRGKTGRTGGINALVRAMKSRRNFSQRTHLIHPIGP